MSRATSSTWASPLKVAPQCLAGLSLSVGLRPCLRAMPVAVVLALLPLCTRHIKGSRMEFCRTAEAADSGASMSSWENHQVAHETCR